MILLKRQRIMAKQRIEIPNSNEYGMTCCQCIHSCCDPLDDDCKYHPTDKDRRCHKLNKSVWNLEDASKCKFYFD